MAKDLDKSQRIWSQSCMYERVRQRVDKVPGQYKISLNTFFSNNFPNRCNRRKCFPLCPFLLHRRYENFQYYEVFLPGSKEHRRGGPAINKSNNKYLDVFTFYQNYEHKPMQGSNNFQVHRYLL